MTKDDEIKLLRKYLNYAALEVRDLGCTCGDNPKEVDANGHELTCVGAQSAKRYFDLAEAKLKEKNGW